MIWVVFIKGTYQFFNFFVIKMIFHLPLEISLLRL